MRARPHAAAVLGAKAFSQAVVCGNGILVRSPPRAFPGPARGRCRLRRHPATRARHLHDGGGNPSSRTDTNTGETHP
ncbi:hypothetical protein BLAT2472_60228 [Burkholderia latens]